MTKQHLSGPRVQVDDDELLVLIRNILDESIFYTGGVHRTHATLRERGIRAAIERVNRVMREAGLLTTQRYGLQRTLKKYSKENGISDSRWRRTLRRFGEKAGWR